jgi:hypothetical protein
MHQAPANRTRSVDLPPHVLVTRTPACRHRDKDALIPGVAMSQVQRADEHCDVSEAESRHESCSRPTPSHNGNHTGGRQEGPVSPVVRKCRPKAPCGPHSESHDHPQAANRS